MSRLFVNNLNDFNIKLFGQTVYYAVIPSSNVPFDTLYSKQPTQLYVVSHFRYVSDIL